jgi:hypothetical protein
MLLIDFGGISSTTEQQHKGKQKCSKGRDNAHRGSTRYAAAQTKRSSTNKKQQRKECSSANKKAATTTADKGTTLQLSMWPVETTNCPHHKHTTAVCRCSQPYYSSLTPFPQGNPPTLPG